MNVKDYRHLLFQSTEKDVTSAASTDFFRNFTNLSKWAKKDYEGKDFFTREHDDKYINRLIRSLREIVEGNIHDIQYLMDTKNTTSTVYTKALKAIRENRITPKMRREYYEKWEDVAVRIFKAFYTNIFISNFLISISSSRLNPEKIEDADPFTDKVMYFFYYGKNAEKHCRTAVDISKLISRVDIEIIQKMKKASSYSCDVFSLFTVEWNEHVPAIASYMEEYSIITPKFHTPSSEFVKLVDQEYPVLDKRFSRSGPVMYPMDMFMRSKLIEDRVNMLLDLISSKKHDDHIADYIKSIIAFEKKYAMEHKSYSYKGENYIQLMYEKIVKGGSFSAFKIFDEVFPIHSYVKNPWSPLFTINDFKSKQLTYCLSHNVDLNKEDGILGRRIAMDPKVSISLGFDTVSKALSDLMQKGMELRFPSSYYMIAIENKDWNLLNFLSGIVSVEIDNDFPLRTAIYEGNMKICWFIFERYQNEEDALKVVRSMAKMPTGCNRTIDNAKVMLSEWRLKNLQ